MNRTIVRRYQLIFTGLLVTAGVVWLALRIVFGQITWAIGGTVLFASLLWLVWRIDPEARSGKSGPRDES